MTDPRDLTTVASVKALMQKTGANAASQDALIQTLITRASVKIMSDYGREFVPGGPDSLSHTGAVRTFEYAWGEQYPGEAFVDLRPYDLQVQAQTAITVVADTDQSAPYTLSTDEWRFWPQPPARGQVYLALKMLPLNMSIGIIGWRKRQVQVTGNWGFPSVPEDVAQACDETVVHWITNYPAARRPDQVDAVSAVAVPRSYPMTAIDLLSGFKRMTV